MLVGKTQIKKTFSGIFFIAMTALCLSSCTVGDQKKLTHVITSNDPEQAFKQYLKNKKTSYQQSPDVMISDIKNLDRTIKNLKSIAEKIWGKNNSQVASNKKYVKYTDGYQSKAQVNFDTGTIKIETIATKSPLFHLKDAIITTLLTSENPANTDIFSDREPIIQGKPYLYGQVLDQDKKAIAYQWRASRFADYLLNTQLKKQKIGKHNVHFVEISMVKSHSKLRQHKYASYVLAAANRYQIKPELIYAIIETESSFNPFAVSHANAYGLMQVIPSTAGKDVYQRIFKKSGTPSKQTLFNPQDNINIGTAYLHILQQQYLNKINNSQSRHYSVISAYNGGAGNVFKTFSSTRSYAPSVINKLSPQQVYQKLTKQHPKSESRRYLYKVVSAEKRYNK
ncbi:membrane-bound lytic murein transglycosylase MltC [Colwellia asteriadis]|uniref:Membrane-bound lytic murein transglycosylase MltC n=1 Tax=Colwellia asteriadis TaxID=517723 RepID=A0ABP3WHR7_9GAMM